MSRIGAEQARKMVEARLGRAPQDALEAAVVLEAWAGLPPDTALTLGGSTLASPQRPAGPSRATRRRPMATDRALLAEGAALVILVVAVALWTGPFGRALGAAVWDDAVRIALPLTLGLQWILRSRYLSSPNGLSSLRRDWSIGLVGFVAVEVLTLRLGLREQVALLLIVTWAAGPIIARRGWGLAYVLALGGVSVAVNAGVDPLPVLAGAAALAILAASFSVTTIKAAHGAAGRMRRAAAAGLMGAGIGGLLVIDTTIGWGTQGSLAAITLIPSTIGGFWGGVHLWRFHEKLPQALTGVPVEEGDRLRFRGPAMGTFTGALARLVGVTAVLSAAVLVAVAHVSDLSPSDSSAGMYPIATVTPPGLTPHSLGGPFAMTAAAPSPAPSHEAAGDNQAGEMALLLGFGGPFAMTPRPAAAPPPAPFHEAAGDNQAGDMALLLGFGLVALATLLIGLLQSLGRPSSAVLSLVCGLAAEIGVQIWGVTPVPGVGLVVGALVAVTVALPPAISLFLRPGRALATTMWIQ